MYKRQHIYLALVTPSQGSVSAQVSGKQSSQTDSLVSPMYGVTNETDNLMPNTGLVFNRKTHEDEFTTRYLETRESVWYELMWVLLTH